MNNKNITNPRKEEDFSLDIVNKKYLNFLALPNLNILELKKVTRSQQTSKEIVRDLIRTK